MFEFVKAGGWLMIPILLCSIIAMAIIFERFFSLRKGRIIPATDVERARKMAATGKITDPMLEALHDSSLMGQVLAVGLESSHSPRHIMKENLEEAGRHAAHRLERYLGTLGTIAAITPLMGLLGTVLGMIDVFAAITKVGVGSPSDLAGGISQALITTAAGISVAILALIFHRYFKGRVDAFVIAMEHEALRLVETSNANAPNRRPTPASLGSQSIQHARPTPQQPQVR